jgi:lipopolysaccharide export system protein LptC
MNDAKSANRLRLTVLLLLFLGIALSSFWLLQVMHKETNEHGPDRSRNDPDYFVDKFTFVRLTKTGQAHYIVNGTNLTHRPLDDSSDIKQPIMRSLAPERAPITISSRDAHIDHDNTRVELTGDVQLDRPAYGAVQRFDLRTPSLVVFPDDEIISTKAPIVANIGGAITTATGMEFDNGKGRLQLLSKGHTIMPPRSNTQPIQQK